MHQSRFENNNSRIILVWNFKKKKKFNTLFNIFKKILICIYIKHFYIKSDIPFYLTLRGEKTQTAKCQMFWIQR